MELQNNTINYVEFTASDLNAIKKFYSSSFGWTFTDYGPDYTAFSDSGLMGGFEKSELPPLKGALIVLYHDKLESIQQKVVDAGAEIVKPIFSFPGGRRFHFTDPGGNELAIWSDQ